MSRQEPRTESDATDSGARIPGPRSGPDDDLGPDGAEVPAATPRKRMRRWKRVTLIIAASLVVLIGGGVLGVSLWLRSVADDVKTVDAFTDVPKDERPQRAEAAKDAMNFLLLGSDSRDPDSQGGSRSDTIIILHLDKTHTKAQMVSIPRDTWVYVPKAKNAEYGNTNAKINAAYSWGGVAGVVQTVERFTNIRLDHVVIVDFSGFKEIVDALGGVEIDVSESFTSTHSLNPDGKRHFDKGPQLMDGAAALDYSRERYAFKDGDFARIQHQQQVIKAILNKAASGGTLSSPTKLNAFLHATANSVIVDGTLNLIDTAMDLRNLRGDDLTFYTSPTKGTGNVGSESVVFADDAAVKPFYEALRDDKPLPAPTK
jgi:LCP family protein required for cell wall assembly